VASTDQAPLLVCALEGPEISGDDDNPAASKRRRLRQELIGETQPSAADAATNEIDHSLSIVIVVLSIQRPDTHRHQFSDESATSPTCTCRTAFPAQHLRPSGILGCWARWPGTHSRILSGIQRAARTVLGVYLKRTCSRVTSASSALGVLNDYTLYKSTHSLTHSLTPVHSCQLT